MNYVTRINTWWRSINRQAGWRTAVALDRKKKVVVMQTVHDMLGQYVFTVHRLDRPTSGVLLLLALSSDVAHRPAQQFERHQVKKHYLAVTRGYLDDERLIDYALTPELDKIADKFAHPEKAPQPAQSHYHTLVWVGLGHQLINSIQRLVDIASLLRGKGFILLKALQ